jgi:hypothetical protein
MDLEGLAEEVRARAGLPETDGVFASTLARRILGEDGVILVAGQCADAYLLEREDGGHQIAIRCGCPDVRQAISRMLALHAIRFIAQISVTATVEDRMMRALAPALLAPASVVRSAHRAFGSGLRHLPRLAKAVGLSQASAHLRLAEVVQGENRAILGGSRPLYRGEGWGEERGRRVSQSLSGVDIGRTALRLIR